MDNEYSLKLKCEEILRKCATKEWNNKELLGKAIEFGKRKHIGQVRKNSGDTYFIHPIRVAINLIDEQNSDIDLIIAALLHDTVEDTETTLEEIENSFGKRIKTLVNRMTKPNSRKKVTLGFQKYYQDYFNKIKRISELDLRVLKIKLSDRIDHVKEYALFATKEKISNYIWESYKYLDLCRDVFLETDLIKIVNKELIILKSFIMKKEL